MTQKGHITQKTTYGMPVSAEIGQADELRFMEIRKSAIQYSAHRKSHMLMQGKCL